MSTYTDNYVNPLEMDVWSLDPNDSKGMVREKGEFMLGLCEQCIGDSLNSRQNACKGKAEHDQGEVQGVAVCRAGAKTEVCGILQ